MTENIKILVVDDDETVRVSHLRILSGSHCQVETALNGMQALQVMERGAFDVVLLDQRMPGMDGLAVLKAIKERWPESEVIIITGYPTVDLAKQAVSLGAYDYLAKPLGPEEVLQATNGAMLHKKWAMRPDAKSHVLPH
jgi:DNA-binding NtrC family response regulator